LEVYGEKFLFFQAEVLGIISCQLSFARETRQININGHLSVAIIFKAFLVLF
jgi:hypothetical protein